MQSIPCRPNYSPTPRPRPQPAEHRLHVFVSRSWHRESHYHYRIIGAAKESSKVVTDNRINLRFRLELPFAEQTRRRMHYLIATALPQALPVRHWVRFRKHGDTPQQPLRACRFAPTTPLD